MAYVYQKSISHAERTTVRSAPTQDGENNVTPVDRRWAIPSMDLFDLPKVLPPRLTRLLPHDLACELRCVPIGCSSHDLTVAMADPTNSDSVRRLEVVTGMTIFPVSCDEDDLNIFLRANWRR
jgi:Type II secretion system (T2SS), protein E, N-terminal domain